MGRVDKKECRASRILLFEKQTSFVGFNAAVHTGRPHRPELAK